MGFVSSLIGYAGKAAVFAAVAWAGIVLGKKFRDKRIRRRRTNKFGGLKTCRSMV